MYIYRAVGTRQVIIALQAFKALLQQHGFTSAFLDDLGIFFLPSEDEREENALTSRSPVDHTLFIYCDGHTPEQLDRALLRLTRRIALIEAEFPGRNSTFPGSQELGSDAWERDIDHFGELASTHTFCSFSSHENQLEEEADDPSLRMSTVGRL